MSSVSDAAKHCGAVNCFWPGIGVERLGNARRIGGAPTQRERGADGPTEDESLAERWSVG